MENYVEIEPLVDNAELQAEAVCPCGCQMCFTVWPDLPISPDGR